MRRDLDSAPALAVRELTSAAELHAISAEWTALWERCPDATVFQRPEWLITWWYYFGQGGLWTIIARDASGRLAGIAPLYVHSDAGVRTVRLLGAGLSDHLDVLVEPEWKLPFADLVEAEIERHPLRWDCVEYQQIPAASALLATAVRHGASTSPGEPCPALELAPWDDSLEVPQCASRRLGDNLAADRRRLERAAGIVTFDAATTTTIGPLLSGLRQLHGQRWALRGEAGVLADERVWSFQHDAAIWLFPSGLVRTYALRVSGRLIGVYYGHVHRGRASYYIAGFDPEHRRFGIGNLLVAHAMREARREGATTFDFLRGQEPYKYRWGAVDQPTFCRRWARRSHFATNLSVQLRAGNNRLPHDRPHDATITGYAPNETTP